MVAYLVKMCRPVAGRSMDTTGQDSFTIWTSSLVRKSCTCFPVRPAGELLDALHPMLHPESHSVSLPRCVPVLLCDSPRESQCVTATLCASTKESQCVTATLCTSPRESQCVTATLCACLAVCFT